jgi:hypothetical protein
MSPLVALMPIQLDMGRGASHTTVIARRAATKQSTKGRSALTCTMYHPQVGGY